MKDFRIAPLPELVFGSGALHSLPGVLKRRGITGVLAVTGGSSLDASGSWDTVSKALASGGIPVERRRVDHEPTPAVVDDIARDARRLGVQGIIGIGGGSVIDTAKAVSAMAVEPGSVRDYLEGIGTSVPSGKRLFLAAVPTTAGTGSEATKNAVISETGPQGFKKSLRHDRYVPDAAVLDPLLALDCPRSISAASGLDAVTQLLEAYISVQANAFTDTLALEGLEKAGRSFERTLESGRDEMARGDMAYAAYLSGVTLANAGLGIVHGAAGVLGGKAPVPHGTACGTLLYGSTKLIAEKLAASGDRGRYFRKKLARAGYALTAAEDSLDYHMGIQLLLETLGRWQEMLENSRFSFYGLTEADLRDAALKSDSKQSPVSFETEEIAGMLLDRL